MLCSNPSRHALSHYVNALHLRRLRKAKAVERIESTSDRSQIVSRTNQSVSHRWQNFRVSQPYRSRRSFPSRGTHVSGVHSVFFTLRPFFDFLASTASSQTASSGGSIPMSSLALSFSSCNAVVSCLILVPVSPESGKRVARSDDKPLCPVLARLSNHLFRATRAVAHLQILELVLARRLIAELLIYVTSS